MTIQFTKNKQTDRFDIIGPADSMIEGSTVTVTKASGETKRVRVDRVSRPFVAKFGPNKGQKVAIASVASSGRRAGGRSDRCKACGGPVVDDPAHIAMEGFCGRCAFDEFDM